MKRNEKVLLFSAAFGLAAALIGAVGLYSDFGSWLRDEPFAKLPQRQMGEQGIILGQVLLNFVFVLAAVLLLFIVKNKPGTRPVFWLLGALCTGISLILCISFFGCGWYFITDPLGAQKYTWFLLSFTALQGLSFFSAGRD